MGLYGLCLSFLSLQQAAFRLWLADPQAHLNTNTTLPMTHARHTPINERRMPPKASGGGKKAGEVVQTRSPAEFFAEHSQVQHHGRGESAHLFMRVSND